MPPSHPCELCRRLITICITFLFHEIQSSVCFKRETQTYAYPNPITIHFNWTLTVLVSALCTWQENSFQLWTWSYEWFLKRKEPIFAGLLIQNPSQFNCCPFLLQPCAAFQRFVFQLPKEAEGGFFISLFFSLWWDKLERQPVGGIKMGRE